VFTPCQFGFQPHRTAGPSLLAPLSASKGQDG
jgi:hypothetical protein